MTIGQLARRVRLRPSAIRYYEAHGVLRPANRSTNGYRLYGPEALTLLDFVRRAKGLGFSLAEMRQVIGVPVGQSPCRVTRALIGRHLSEVEGELLRLHSLRDRLATLLHQPDPTKTEGVCPLIDGERILDEDAETAPKRGHRRLKAKPKVAAAPVPR